MRQLFTQKFNEVKKLIIRSESIKLENFSNIMLIRVLRTGNILPTLKESIQQVLESYQWDNKY